MKRNPRPAETRRIKSFEFLDRELSAGDPEEVVLGKVAVVVCVSDGMSEASIAGLLLAEV